MNIRISLRIQVCLICVALSAQASGQVNKVDRETQEKATADLRARIEASPQLPFYGMQFAAKPPAIGWGSGAVSWVAVDRSGHIYEIQRGDKADPVLVLDREGKVLRSWGKGEFNIPHSIRIDPSGNVWTVDAGSSVVIKYSPLGEKLMTITVGERPDNGSPSTEPLTSPLGLTGVYTSRMATVTLESSNTPPTARG